MHSRMLLIHITHSLVLTWILTFTKSQKSSVQSIFLKMQTGRPVLKEILINSHLNHVFVDDDVNASLSRWCNLFLSAVDDHIPKRVCHSVYDPPWIDKELLDLQKKKNAQRRKSKKSRSQKDVEKYKSLRRQSKISYC